MRNFLAGEGSSFLLMGVVVLAAFATIAALLWWRVAKRLKQTS